MPVDSALITYLIANHNNGVYLEDCLRSLSAQTDPAWQAIIYDDASTDDSVTQLNAVSDPRIRLVCSDVNQGYIRTLKCLIAEATTDIVAILDADDMLAPLATERVRQAYAQHPDCGLVYTNYESFKDDAEGERRPGACAQPPAGKTTLTHGYISHLKTFRKSTYAQTEGLNGKLEYAEDRDLAYKLEEVTTPVFVNEPLYLYREVAGSQSRDPSKTRTGFHNHLRAQFAAVQRRGVTGLTKLHMQTYFLTEHARLSGHLQDLDEPLKGMQDSLRNFL